MAEATESGAMRGNVSLNSRGPVQLHRQILLRVISNKLENPSHSRRPSSKVSEIKIVQDVVPDSLKRWHVNSSLLEMEAHM